MTQYSPKGRGNPYATSVRRVHMRLRLAIAVMAILLSGMLPVGSASASTSCEASGDAPGGSIGAPTLPVPSRCEGGYSSTDVSDVYAFTVVAGKPLYVYVDSEDTWIGSGLLAPDGTVWTMSDLGDSHSFIAIDAPVSGTWYVWLDQEGATDDARYTLGLHQEATSYTGTIVLASVDAVRLTRALGPPATGVDGAWIPLPSTATGNETAWLHYAAAINSVARLTFFDSTGTELDSCEDESHLTGGEPRRCGIPPGTTKILIESGSPVAMDYSLTVYH